MGQGVLFGLALLPVAIVFVLLVVMRRSARLAMLVAYAATAIIALTVWGQNLGTVAGATVTVAAVEPGSGAGEGEETTVEQVLSVDADTEVVATVSATADDVAEGSCLTARGEADDLGAVTADSVALSEPVDGSCATGRGGPGGGRGPGAGIAEDAQGDA